MGKEEREKAYASGKHNIGKRGIEEIG